MKASRVIPLNLVDIYVIINEYIETVNLCRKYKTVDKKVKLVVIP
jgi:hypothetical protein